MGRRRVGEGEEVVGTKGGGIIVAEGAVVVILSLLLVL